jgi:DNA-binding MarR family transcriptional regulator
MAVGFDQHFADHGITQAQFRLMTAIWNIGQHDGATPSELSEYLFIERATVSVLIKRMLAEGLLSRHPGTDRRSYRVRITKRGGQVLTALLPQARDVADHLLSSIPATDQRRFERYLEKVEQTLREDAARAP